MSTTEQRRFLPCVRDQFLFYIKPNENIKTFGKTEEIIENCFFGKHRRNNLFFLRFFSSSYTERDRYNLESGRAPQTTHGASGLKRFAFVLLNLNRKFTQQLLHIFVISLRILSQVWERML